MSSHPGKEQAKGKGKEQAKEIIQCRLTPFHPGKGKGKGPGKGQGKGQGKGKGQAKEQGIIQCHVMPSHPGREMSCNAIQQFNVM